MRPKLDVPRRILERRRRDVWKW